MRLRGGLGEGGADEGEGRCGTWWNMQAQCGTLILPTAVAYLPGAMYRQ